jgi:hypothetical protein
MARVMRITDLSPEQLAEWKPLLDEQLTKALSVAEIKIAGLRGENAELRTGLAECQADAPKYLRAENKRLRNAAQAFEEQLSRTEDEAADLRRQLDRERLAAIQHDIWSHWTRYQFSVCQRNDDGSLTIPAEKVERWERQAATPYSALSEAERESDRDQADKVIAPSE